MKVYIFIIFYIFSSFFYVLAKENTIDNIKVIVNDQIILNSDVNQILFLLKKEGKGFRVPLKSDFLKEKIIQKLIIDSLILQEANKMNITITTEQLNTVIKNIALKKNMSVNELKNHILFNNLSDNFYYDNYIKNIENSLKIKIMQDYELHKRINVSEQEVNFIFKKLIKDHKKLKRINLSYILLPSLKEHSNYITGNKKILAENIANKLRNGYNFEKLYLDFKKSKNILLVKKRFWMRLIDIKNIFSKTLNIFQKGQILGPFLGEKGFYILKVNDIDNNKENIVTEFYIQHCLIEPSIILTDTESKKNIFNIYNKIKKGIYSFDYAVKYLSHDFFSSNKKGNLGWVTKDFFNTNFNKQLLLLHKNEISEPIKSNFGWHIIKLLDKRQIDAFYKFKKQEAYEILLEKKMILEKHHWIEDLKKNSYIKIIR